MICPSCKAEYQEGYTTVCKSCNIDLIESIDNQTQSSTTSAAGKIILGLFTFLPFIFFIVMMCLFGFMFMRVFTGDQGQSEFPQVFISVIVFQMIMIICSLALMIIYIIKAFTNPVIGQVEKIIWVIVIFMFGMVAMPIYWFFYIWQDRKEGLIKENWPTIVK